MPYAFREVLASLRRTPLLAVLSVVAIAFSLFVVGLFGLTAYNIREAIEQVESRVEVVAYLRDEARPEQVRAAAEEMRRLPEVLSVREVSRTEALAEAMAEMEEFREVFGGLETNPLPASLEVRLRPGRRDPGTVERVAARMEAFAFVEDVRYGRDWLGQIYTLRRIAGGAAAIIGGAFAVVAAVIIGTAIRISVFARREEISIMRLVGATDGFVQRPFLLEGFLAGLLGGAAAAGLTWGAYRVVGSLLFEIAWLPGEWVGLFVVVGAVFGLLSSIVAVRRHLGAV